jgi:hypothetical protein
VKFGACEPGTIALSSSDRHMVTEVRCLQLLLSAARTGQNEGALSRIEKLQVGAEALLGENGTLTLLVQAASAASAPGSAVYRVVSFPPADPEKPPHMEAILHFASSVGSGVGPGPSEPPALLPEISTALDRRGKPRNGLALLSSINRVAGNAVAREAVVWAWGTRYDEVVGGVRLSEPLEEPLEAFALGELIDGAFWLADFGWYGLSGAVHRFGGVKSGCFYRVPRPGEELLLHVRLLPPAAGAWSADVIATDGALSVVATLNGLFGLPVSHLSGAVWDEQEKDGSGIAWQHFYRRMHHQLLEGEDHSW